MIDASAKDYLHSDLRDVRAAMLWKLDGLSEYDARRPLTPTATNLLGLIKHLTNTEARYFGEVFGRPYPDRRAWWGDEGYEAFDDLWAREDEPVELILDGSRRACEHSDETIAALSLDSPGHVPWWPRPDVTLFKVLVHVLTETNRHAGHADILREQVDGAVGTEAGDAVVTAFPPDFWRAHHAKVEQAARSAAAGG